MVGVFVHGKGLVHGDVCPDNVMLCMHLTSACRGKQPWMAAERLSEEYCGREATGVEWIDDPNTDSWCWQCG